MVDQFLKINNSLVGVYAIAFQDSYKYRIILIDYLAAC